jgi:hypothetical protein
MFEIGGAAHGSTLVEVRSVANGDELIALIRQRIQAFLGHAIV